MDFAFAIHTTTQARSQNNVLMQAPPAITTRPSQPPCIAFACLPHPQGATASLRASSSRETKVNAGIGGPTSAAGRMCRGNLMWSPDLRCQQNMWAKLMLILRNVMWLRKFVSTSPLISSELLTISHDLVSATFSLLLLLEKPILEAVHRSTMCSTTAQHGYGSSVSLGPLLPPTFQ